jgi:hypothetical protein
MKDAHRPGFHAYCVSNDVLEANVVINVPKLKTHKKGGITAALKNLVGINGHKSYLPHHRQGSTAEGGDEYALRDRNKWAQSRLLDFVYQEGTAKWRQRLASLAVTGLAAAGRLTRKDGTETGSWYGNDTLWRTCIDLNRILLFTDGNGEFGGTDSTCTPLRRVFHLVDGIYGGDCDGPLAPNPRPSGVLLAGTAAPYVDLAAALIIGFPWRRIPLIRAAFEDVRGAPIVQGRPEDLRVASNDPNWNERSLSSIDWAFPDSLEYTPPPGWESVLSPESKSEHRIARVPLLAAARRPGLFRQLPHGPPR